MTYDATAQKLGVKVIGTVESNLNYAAINYSDPITVGVSQWYGTRAASVLERMRTTNAADWYGVAASLNNQLATIPQNDPFWDSRYITSAEGQSLVGVLSRNQVIQNAQIVDDMEDYKAVAISYGFNPDTNTETVLYFFVMHHQSPASALEVVQTLDTTATLDQIHAATLAHPVLGQYGARYRTAYDLINDGGVGGVDPAPPVEQPAPKPVNGNTHRIEKSGNMLMVTFEDGERLPFLPTGRGQYLRGAQGKLPAPEPTPTQPPPPADTGATGDWTHPLPGATVSSPYGLRPTPPGSAPINGGYHYGVDLVTISAGASVLAPTKLVITRAVEWGTPGDPSGGTAGSYVKGHTVDGAYTFNFFHMVQGSLNVTAGQTVNPGTVLGIEGATGNVTGRHLHLECYPGNFDDPWPPPYGNPTEPLAVLRNHGVTI